MCFVWSLLIYLRSYDVPQLILLEFYSARILYFRYQKIQLDESEFM